MADAPIVAGPGDVADERGQFHPAPGPLDPSGDPAPAGSCSSEPNERIPDAPAAPKPTGDPDAEANAPDPSRPIS